MKQVRELPIAQSAKAKNCWKISSDALISSKRNSHICRTGGLSLGQMASLRHTLREWGLFFMILMKLTVFT